MVLIKQQTRGQMSQALIRKSRRGEKLQALDLSEMGSFAQGKEVEELRDIVAPASSPVSKIPLSESETGNAIERRTG